MRLTVRLRLHKGSEAILGDAENVDTAVVFVHGFGGDARKTWLQFQILVEELKDEFPWWQGCDLYFWHHRSAWDRVADSARDLRTFIDSVFPRPKKDLLKSDQEFLNEFIGVKLPSEDYGTTRSYKKLLIIGHSQGAVLVREAVWTVFKRWRDHAGAGKVMHPLLNSQLRLFAPAMLGASLAGPWGFFQEFFLTGFLVNPFLKSMPGYKDLEATNLYLSKLCDWTGHAAKENPSIAGLKARVLFGKDKVVSPGAYEYDADEDPELDQSHQSICKPTKLYKRPLSFARYEQSESTAS